MDARSVLRMLENPFVLVRCWLKVHVHSKAEELVLDFVLWFKTNNVMQFS